MIWPAPLRPGSRVRVPTPASPARDPYLAAGLAEISRQGWVPDHSPRSPADRHLYLAAPDPARAAELIEALADLQADAVWVARGGYGCGRLLPDLDRAFPCPPDQPKAVVGCSDATFLLLYIQQRWGWVTFHGPVVAGDWGGGPERVDRAQVTALLTGRPAPEPHRLERLRGGAAVTAPLTGGCLSIVAAGLGTPWACRADDRLLFLEDCDEKPYQVDRMLTQLRQAGLFDRCRGVVFGRMVGCRQHPDQDYTIADVIRHALAGLDLPVLFGLPSGHADTPAVALALGAAYRLDPATATLQLAEAPP